VALCRLPRRASRRSPLPRQRSLGPARRGGTRASAEALVFTYDSLGRVITETTLAGTTFTTYGPEVRAAQLQTADEAVVRLRERLRLAGALGLLSPGALRQLTAQLSVIGRMIGGRRRLGPHVRAPPR
jgi:YD repeat-containing protein